jgi:hypothetical protein
MIMLRKFLLPQKFRLAKRHFGERTLTILDIGCADNSAANTKHWFPGSTYHGADVKNDTSEDAERQMMGRFFPLTVAGDGYEAIPDRYYDFIIMNHVIEHMPDPAPIVAKLCRKLKPGGLIWIAFPSMRSLNFPPGIGTMQFCDDPTHVFLPEVREVANMLLSNGVRVLRGGRSRNAVRSLIGIAILPYSLALLLATGRLKALGLLYLLGAEDFVFGQARLATDAPAVAQDFAAGNRSARPQAAAATSD